MLIRDFFADQQVSEEEKKAARPNGANNENSLIKNLFDARKKYTNESINYVKQISGDVPFSDLYRKNILYGTLDLEGDVIIPKNVEINMSYVEEKLLLQDFAADAIKGMKAYISDAVLCGKISPNSPYANFKIKKAFKDLTDIQRANLINLAFAFKSVIGNDKVLNAEITNIDIFTKKYVNFLYKEAISLPITKTQTALFYNFTFFFNGITFSIADDKAGDDTNKYDNYLTDPSFSFFSEACRRFGFKIDKNIPWIITVDFNSPANFGKNGNHIGHITKTGLNNISEIFSRRYIKVYKQEILELKNHFYDAYQIFLSNNNIYYRESDSKLCARDVKSSPNIYVRDNITREKFFQQYTDKFWLRVYAYLRNQESRKGLTQQQFENIVREAGEYSAVNKTNEALKYLNSYFKEYKELNFIDTLQNEKDLVQLVATNAGMPFIVF